MSDDASGQYMLDRDGHPVFVSRTISLASPVETDSVSFDAVYSYLRAKLAESTPPERERGNKRQRKKRRKANEGLK